MSSTSTTKYCPQRNKGSAFHSAQVTGSTVNKQVLVTMFQLVLYRLQFSGIVPRRREGKTTLYSTKHLDAAMKFIPKQLTDGLITLKDAVSKYNFPIPNLRYLIIRFGIQSEKIHGKTMFRETDFKKIYTSFKTS